MDVARKRAEDAAERAQQLTARAASWAGLPGEALVGAGLAFMLAAAVVAATGRFAAGGAIAAAAAVAAFGGRSAASSQGYPSRWIGYLCTMQNRVCDAPVLGAVAWWFRLGRPRAAAVAVAAMSLGFLGAYADVRGLSLGFPPSPPLVAAPERAAIVAAGLLVPHVSEPALWAVAAAGAASFARATVSAWRRAT